MYIYYLQGHDVISMDESCHTHGLVTGKAMHRRPYIATDTYYTPLCHPNV